MYKSMSETALKEPAFRIPFLPRRTSNAMALPAALILLALMISNINTFTLNTTTLTNTISSGIYALWLISLYALMLYSGKIAFYRRLFFVVTAVLFFPAFMHDLIVERGFVALNQSHIANTEAPFCHIVIPITLIPAVLSKTVIFPARLSGHYASIYGMLTIWLIASITLGRGWCSWVCFYGGWDEGFSKIRKRRLLNIDNVPPAIRYFGFSMLMFVVLVGLSTASSVYCEWFCPFKLVTEFSAIESIMSYIATIMFILIFFSLVVVLPLLTKKRTQCAMFCPFGAFQSFTNKINVYKVKIDHSKCRQCLMCVKACPTLSLSKEHIKEKSVEPGITCTKCMECVNTCPHGAITLEYSAPMPKRLKTKIESLYSRLQEKNTRISRFVLTIIGTIKELLNPKALFPFTAFTFGMIISSEFAIHTISLIVSAFTGGV